MHLHCYQQEGILWHYKSVMQPTDHNPNPFPKNKLYAFYAKL